jgi:adenosylhomocysteine nucleosidase
MRLVTFALPEESGSFRKLLRITGARARHARDGQNVRGDLRVLHVGVGPARARENVRAFFADALPEFVCAAGFAGGLDPRVSVGDLVLDTHQSDAILVGTTRRALLHAFCFRDDPDVDAPGATQSATAPPSAIWCGRIASSPAVLESAAEKQASFSRTRALAVDMESETIAEECRAAGVPFISLRVISDDATRDLPVPLRHWFNMKKQRPDRTALLGFLMRHPRKIFPFYTFVRSLARARTNLARALMLFIDAQHRDAALQPTSHAAHGGIPQK